MQKLNLNSNNRRYHTYGKSWRCLEARKKRTPVTAILKGLSLFFSGKDKKIFNFRLW
ncbi:MAG: hypothetical protein V1712_03910 [Patescibacteria group bacterium]